MYVICEKNKYIKREFIKDFKDLLTSTKNLNLKLKIELF